MTEGDQIKDAIRTLFETSRNGMMYDREEPLRILIDHVNGNSTATLCLFKHPEIKGGVVMWYEPII